MVGTITPETRIIDLTVGQLMDLIAKAQAPVVEKKPEQTKRLVYGISGIAQLFNCSMTTANRIKASGKGNVSSLTPSPNMGVSSWLMPTKHCYYSTTLNNS